MKLHCIIIQAISGQHEFNATNLIPGVNYRIAVTVFSKHGFATSFLSVATELSKGMI